MKYDLRYLGHSGVSETGSSATLQFQPNLSRDKVFFDQRLKNPLRFREAISALHEVVVGDFRFRKRDKSAYEAFKAQRTADEQQVRQAVMQAETKARVEEMQREGRPPNLDADFRKMHGLYWSARRQWANELSRNDPEMFRALVPCDPVVTVAPDTVFFECFAKDESSYGCLYVDRESFEGTQASGLGTTNVDYSIALFEHFQTLRTYRETRLLVDPSGFEVNVANSGSLREEKIDLPPTWLKGFGQLSSVMALPGREVELSVDAVYSVLAFLKRHREKAGPRSLVFQLTPGRPVSIRIEPFGVVVDSRGAKVEGDKPQEIKVWGRRRLSVLARLLPLADRVTVRLLGTGLPSVFTVHMGDMRFVLALSGWTTNDWAGGASLELLAGHLKVDWAVAARLEAALRQKHVASFAQLAETVGADRQSMLGALHALSKQGQVIFDFSQKVYRYRPVMPVALSESVLGPPSVELTEALKLADRQAVQIVRREPLPGARMLVQAKIQDTPQSKARELEAVFDGDGGFSKARCTCDVFRHAGLRKGPCRHLLTLKLNETAVEQKLPLDWLH